MSTTTLESSFHVSLLRNGINAFIEKSVVQWDSSGNESAGSLLQIYDSSSAEYSVDWTEEANQPILKLAVALSDGSHATISDVAYTYDGKALSFSGSNVELGGQTWTKDSTGKFAFLHYTGDDNIDYVLLRVLANLADEDNLTDTTIGYTITFTASSAGTGELSGTEDVLLHEGGGNSLSVNITSTDTTFNSKDETITLTAVAYSGVTQLTIDGENYQIVWFKNAVTFMGVGETLELGVDDVDSTAVFTAYLTNDPDSVAEDGSGDWDMNASDTIRVTDTTDPYTLVYSTTYGGAFSASQTEKVTVTVWSGNTQVTDATFTWAYTVYNCAKVAMATGTGSGDTLTVPIEYAYAAFTKTVDEEDVSGYGDVDLAVTLALEIA